MRAYIITPADAAQPRSWGTVRADAKNVARDVGGAWAEVEVPNKLGDLVPFLNQLEQEALLRGQGAPAPAQAPDVALEALPAPTPLQPALAALAPHQRPGIPVAPPKAGSPDHRALDPLVDWLFDDAEQWQIERIMAALSTRFGEAVRAARPKAA